MIKEHDENDDYDVCLLQLWPDPSCRLQKNTNIGPMHCRRHNGMTKCSSDPRLKIDSDWLFVESEIIDEPLQVTRRRYHGDIVDYYSASIGCEAG